MTTVNPLTAWALDVLFQQACPALEDAEMAAAIYDRNVDEQLGLTKGPRGALRPLFPEGRSHTVREQPDGMLYLDWDAS